MKSIEVKAKSIHEAIADACEKLGVAQDEVNVEILEQGGMFKKACIRATVKEEVLRTKTPAPATTEARPAVTKSGAATEIAKAVEEAPQRSTKVDGTARAKRVPQAPSTNGANSVSQPPPKTTPTVPGQKFDKTLSFITKLLELLENNSTVTTEHTDKSFNININGDNVGRLIGKGGEVLNALQTLVSSIAISNAGGEGKRVFVNVADYKDRRGDNLQSLAMRKAEQVKSTGRTIKLDPMNARDRAIIHTALGSIEGIKTFSTGKDPFRCLCIAPADKDKPDKPEKKDTPAQKPQS